MASILIAGCGDIGCKLGEILSKNHQVYALRRNIDSVPAKLHPVQVDLNHKPDKLPDNIDYVFYMVSAEKYKDSAYYNAYVLGLKNLLSALENQNIKRLFFISSTSVFAQNEGEQVNENSPTDPHSFSAKRILEGEELALNSQIPATVVRFGGIYGPGRTHLIDLVREGKAHCMEDLWSNRIHSADCVGILEHLINMTVAGKELKKIYLGVDCQPTLLCAVYDWLAEQLNVPDSEHFEPTEHSRQMRNNKRISNARILETGYQFKYPDYQTGYLELLENEEPLN